MSPAENRRARDAVRRPKPQCSGSKGPSKIVPCARRFAASRAAPRFSRGHSNLRAPSAAEFSAWAKDTAPRFAIRYSLFALGPPFGMLTTLQN